MGLITIKKIQFTIIQNIKDYKDQFHYTYRGIKTTLHYFYEIQEGNSVEDSLGIGIVPFVYDEAKKFYIDEKAIKDNLKDCDMQKVQNRKKVIHINRNQDEKNKYKEMALINIEEL